MAKPAHLLALAACAAVLAAPAQQRSTLAFPPQSVETASDPRTVTIINNSGTRLSVASVVSPDPFVVTHQCSNVSPGASCPLHVTYAPKNFAGAIAATSPVSRTISVFGPNAKSPQVIITATGTAEKSLVTHFYRSILRREPDAAGKAYWNGEAQRLVTAGASVNEAWYAMAAQFFSGAEYAALGRSTRGYVTDLYRTFLAREPEAAGLTYWIGQIDGGLPREVARVAFMFSPEFTGLSTRVFGAVDVRAESDVVLDFYRGLLARLPDATGYEAWVRRFRAAQCKGPDAVAAEADAISYAFAASGEYSGRGRTHAQYVADLYDAFLRRGGDVAGVRYWIDELSAGRIDREGVRRQFLASAEFRARVAAISGERCIP